MGKQAKILLSGAMVAALAVALFWFWPSKQSGEKPGEPHGGRTDSGGKQDPPWTERLPDPRSLKKPDDVSEEDWNTFLRNRAIAEASNRNILFYGKVADQNGDPVAGARIKATAVSRTGVARVLTTGEGQSKNQLEATTAQNGRFKMDGGKGFALNFKKIECDGYVLSPQTESQFMYGQLLRDPSSSRFHHPDPAKPVVFRMWKLGELELLHTWKAVSIYAGRSGRMQDHYINLRTMKATTEEPPEWDIFVDGERRKDGSWWGKIEISGGGLQFVRDQPFLFEAPENGYTRQMSFHGESDRDTKGPFSVYLKSRNGSLHASFVMELTPWTAGGVYFDLKDVRVNPHGSRNLQYDGSNRIKQGFR